jgi:hypothetical protein
MGIKEVSYEESRLVSTGQFENMRVTIAAGATIEVGQTADQALAVVQSFVRTKIRQRIVGGIVGEAANKAKAAEKAIAKRYNLGEDDDAEIDYSRG